MVESHLALLDVLIEKTRWGGLPVMFHRSDSSRRDEPFDETTPLVEKDVKQLSGGMDCGSMVEKAQIRT